MTSDRKLGFVRRLTDLMPEATAADGMRVDARAATRRDGGSIRILVHEPDARTRPSGALLWIHGGGLVMGRPEQSADFCERTARDLGILVANVDYRLAPDDPFPAGLDDCMDALAWLHDHADDLGIDPAAIAVGGDSAGGGLAAAVAQRAHDEGTHRVAFQALVYPMLDDRTVAQPDHAGRGRFVWTPESNAFGWTAYLGRRPGSDDVPAYAAPARRADLSGLPPAWVGVGDLDLFHDEDVDYARRLEAAGVPCDLHVVPGWYHGADALAAKAPSSVEFHRRLAAALRSALTTADA